MIFATRLYELARSWLPLLPLLLLLAATYWLNQQVQPLPPAETVQRHDVDLVIDNFTATALNENGTPRYIIAARKLWHYPDDDSTYLHMPTITSLYPGRPPTITSALNGNLTSKGDQVYLQNNVTIVRPAGPNFLEQHFNTEYLHVVPDQDWADTDRPVVMSDKYNVIHAVGLELDNKNQTAKLLSQVRAYHEPAPR